MRRARLVVTLAGCTLLGAACASLPIIGRAAPERWAFTAPWDDRSFTSARAHAGALDAIVVDWIQLVSDMRVGGDYADSLSRLVPSSTRRMALVTSWSGERFRPDLIRRLAMIDTSALSTVSAELAERLRNSGVRAMVIDFEGMTAADTAITRAVIGTLSREAHAHGLQSIVAIPPTDTSGYPARLFPNADLLLIMLYDEHWATSPPGAIASPEWVRRSLALRVSEVGAKRIVAALPLYGYQWPAKGQPARTISHAEAVRLAAEAGVALERDPASQTLHASRPGGDGWQLWVTDAVQLAALEREVASLNVRRVAYWRLGLEDPAMWVR